MRHFVIGTAGHIDHGKSALVKALTGTDPDRLEEEKRRGMTIDLGFAHFDLPSGRRVGIVDVPGHERLIKNMLAGATGIDLVLLVVAADEGVMPQTREHLDILRFLPVRVGIVVLNKIDLAADQGWVDLVKDELAGLTRGTFLERAPLIEVSAKTGQGIPALVETIDRALERVSVRETDAPARLPVDRSFTMAGFGTVVTGTLWSGRVAPGDVLELLPRGREVRVRGVQSHGHAVEAGTAGSRVAVNLAGIDKDEVERGHVLATPGVFTPTARLDVRLRLLPGAPALAHLARVRVYLGADEIIARVALIDRKRLEPESEADAQLRLERPTVADAGDPIVIRRYSPMQTLGGGTVLNAHPPLRRRGEMSARRAGTTIDERVDDAVSQAGPAGATVEDLMAEASAARPQVEQAVSRLASAGRLVVIRGRVFHADSGEKIRQTIRREVAAYHEAVPWRPGMPKEELKTKTFPAGDARFYAAVLEELTGKSEVEDAGNFIRLPGFSPKLSPQDTAVRARIADALLRGRFAPPGREELSRDIEPKLFERLFQSLLDDGTIVEVAPSVYFHRNALDEIKRTVAELVASNGTVTVASLRDRLQTSRKYALTVLEYFDTIKLTRRVGDARVLLDRSKLPDPLDRGGQ